MRMPSAAAEAAVNETDFDSDRQPSLDASAATTTFKEGYMFVRIGTEPTTQRLFLVLNRKRMLCFASHEDVSPQARFALAGLLIESGGRPEAPYGYAFFLSDAGRRVLAAFAPSEAVRREWMLALRDVGGVVDPQWQALEADLRTASAVAVQCCVRGWLTRRRYSEITARKELVGILVEDERGFVAELDALADAYRTPLLTAVDSEAPILFASGEVLAIFPCVPELRAAHRALLAKLETRWQRWNAFAHIGDCFVELVENTSGLYRTYARELPHALSMLNKCEERSQALRQFIGRCEAAGYANPHAVLPKPLYRIEKYRILLQNIERLTTLQDHSDAPLLRKALHMLAVIAAAMANAAAPQAQAPANAVAAAASSPPGAAPAHARAKK